VPKATINPVEVTDSPSCYDIQDGYRIKVNESLADFYNSRFSGKTQVGVIAHPDYVEIHDKHNRNNQIYVDFKRTVRVPDSHQTYELPAPSASFPLLISRHFSSTLPESMRKKDGVFFPMLQREALVLAFTSSGNDQSQFAIRVLTGGVNALTGRSLTQNSSHLIERYQDYIVAPQQQLLSGYRANGSMRQFVAMPMGDKYTIEHQLTSDEFIGGIQLELIPRLRDTAMFKTSPPDSDPQKREGQDPLDLFITPRELGLQPGQRVFMLDQRPNCLYDFPREKREPIKDLVEPAFYSNYHVSRPTFIGELYDGPSCTRFDLSSSLIVSVIKPIQITAGPLSHWRTTFQSSRPRSYQFSPPILLPRGWC